MRNWISFCLDVWFENSCVSTLSTSIYLSYDISMSVPLRFSLATFEPLIMWTFEVHQVSCESPSCCRTAQTDWHGKSGGSLYLPPICWIKVLISIQNLPNFLKMYLARQPYTALDESTRPWPTWFRSLGTLLDLTAALLDRSTTYIYIYIYL